MRKIICIAFLCLISSSCNSPHYSAEQDYLMEESKMEINFGDELVTPVFTNYTLAKFDNKDYHIFLDQLDQIVISDLENQISLNIIPIQTGEGPEAISKGIYGIASLDLETFLIESRPDFYVINEKGAVIAKTNVAEKIKNLIDDGSNDHFGVSFLGYSNNITEEGDFILTAFRYQQETSVSYPLFPLFVRLIIQEDYQIELEPVDIRFPDEFIGENHLSYGQNEKPKSAVYGDWLVYNFIFSSRVFFYNLKDGSSKILDLKIENGVNFSPPDETEPHYSNFTMTSFLMPVLDLENKLIYRWHINSNQEDGMQSSNFLTVFDMEGNKFMEYEAGRNKDRLLRNPFIYKGHFYTNHFFPESSDENLEFVRFKLVEK